MTVQDLATQLNLTPFHLEDGRRQVTGGGYCGDLLSWVMGKAPADGGLADHYEQRQRGGGGRPHRRGLRHSHRVRHPG